MNYSTTHKSNVIAVLQYVDCVNNLRSELRERAVETVDRYVVDDFPRILSDETVARSAVSLLTEILENYDYDRIIETNETLYEGNAL